MLIGGSLGLSLIREVNRELEIITSFQNNNRTKKADKFHRKLMTSVRTFVE